MARTRAVCTCGSDRCRVICDDDQRIIEDLFEKPVPAYTEFRRLRGGSAIVERKRQ